MKRLTAILLILIFMISAFSACTAKPVENSETEASVPIKTQENVPASSEHAPENQQTEVPGSEPSSTQTLTETVLPDPESQENITTTEKTSVDSGNEPPESTDTQTEADDSEEDLDDEIIDDYVVDVTGNIGVGGN